MTRKLTVVSILLGGLGLALFLLLSLAGRTQAGEDNTTFLPLVLSPLNYDILLDGAAFTPHVMAVQTGTAVTWKNGESSPQSITAGLGAFNSPELPPNSLFNWQATAGGIYTYTTAADSSIEGALVVSENGAADWFDGRTPPRPMPTPALAATALTAAAALAPPCCPARSPNLTLSILTRSRTAVPAPSCRPGGIWGCAMKKSGCCWDSCAANRKMPASNGIWMTSWPATPS